MIRWSHGASGSLTMISVAPVFSQKKKRKKERKRERDDRDEVNVLVENGGRGGSLGRMLGVWGKTVNDGAVARRSFRRMTLSARCSASPPSTTAFVPTVNQVFWKLLAPVPGLRLPGLYLLFVALFPVFGVFGHSHSVLLPVDFEQFPRIPWLVRLLAIRNYY